MGAYNSTFIGIYLELPFVKSTVTEKFFVHPETGKKQKNRFDENTGRENLPKTEEKIVYIEPSPYISDVEGFREDMFFLPAYTGGGKRIQTFVFDSDEKYYYQGNELFNYDISSKNIPQLIEEFKVEYKKYLDYYTEKYGKLEVKFGVVNYAH